MDLIREDSHYNNISTFFDKKKKKFYKITYSIYGKKLIKEEIKGIKFFNSINKKKKINFKLIGNKDYQKLATDWIIGKKANYNDSFDSNFRYFESLVNYYLNNWPKNNLQTCHGDLTLDNIIFDKKFISIIDWEHYKVSKKIFYGFDLIYLLLSGIILPGEEKFNTKSKLKFKLIYINLYKSKIKSKILDNPIENIDKVICDILLEQFIVSPFKFITFNCSKTFLNEINNFILKDIVNDKFK